MELEADREEETAAVDGKGGENEGKHVGDGWLQSHDTNRDAGPGWEERLLSYQARREVKKV